MKLLIDALAQVPAAAYAALIASLVTAFVALVGVALTNRSNNERLRIQLRHDLELKNGELRRDRLEDLYLIAEFWTKAMVTHYLPYIKVMREELTYDQALDLTIEWGKGKDGNFEKAEMIVEFYFPDLKPPLQEVIDARDIANKIQAAHKRRYKKGDTDGREFVQPLLDAMKAIDEKSNALRAKIIETAIGQQTPSLYASSQIPILQNSEAGPRA